MFIPIILCIIYLVVSLSIFIPLMTYEIVFTPLIISGVFILVLSSLFIPIYQFKYLFNRSSVDYYHQLPIKREKLYLIKYLEGLLYISVPYLLFSLFNIVLFKLNINMINSNINNDITIDVIGNTSMLITIPIKFFVMAIMLYSFVCLIGVIVSRLYIHLLLPVVVIISTIITDLFINMMLQEYVNAGIVSSDNFLITKISNVLAFNIDNQSEYSPVNSHKSIVYNFESVNFSLFNVLFFLTGTLLFIVFAVFIYKKRLSENTSKSIAFESFKVVITSYLSITIPFVLTFFISFLTNSYDGTTKYLITYFIFSILTYLLLTFIFNESTKKIFSKFYYVLIPVVIGFAIIIMLTTDVLGLNNKIPSLNKIDNVTITFDYSNVYTYADASNIEKITILHEKIKDTPDTTYSQPYVTYGDKTSVVELSYKLKNGNNFKRNFLVDLTTDTTYDLQDILTSTATKESDINNLILFQQQIPYKNDFQFSLSSVLSNVYTYYDYMNYDYILDDSYYDESKLTQQEISEFIDYYIIDITNDDTYGLLNYQTIPLGEFTTYIYGDNYLRYSIRPTYQNSINYLSKHDIDLYDNIEKLEIYTISEDLDVDTSTAFSYYLPYHNINSPSSIYNKEYSTEIYQVDYNDSVPERTVVKTIKNKQDIEEFMKTTSSMTVDYLSENINNNEIKRLMVYNTNNNLGNEIGIIK